MEKLRERLFNLTKDSSSSILVDLQANNTKSNIKDFTYVIPNNNNKYLLYITDALKLPSFQNQNKKINEKDKDKALCLYFCGKNDEFCIEIEYQIELEKYIDILFEGFLYKEKNSLIYQIFDILYLNSKKLESNYSHRYTMLTELLYKSDQLIFKDLNTILTLEAIQPFYTSEDYQFFSKCNKMSNQFTHYLYFSDSVDKKFMDEIQKKELKRSLLISKGQKTEIYDVCDPETNDNLGILYIPTIEKSKWIKEMFTKETSIKMDCIFNYKFNKWTLVK